MTPAIVAILLFAGLLGPAQAQQLKPKAKEYDQVDIDEHLGKQIPLDLTFADEQGKPVQLSEFFHQGRPVMLVLAYYECPMLCTLVLNGVSAVVAQVPLNAGEDYQIVTVSINPKETPELATAKQKSYIKSAGGKLTNADWRFLTGKEEQIKQLADALGFRYEYVPAKDQYAHPAVLHVLTGEGRVSRYLYGIQFTPKDVKLALLEASNGKIGTIVDRIILTCYHYDPQSGKYTLFATNLMRLGGVATVLLLGLVVGTLWYREKHPRHSDSPTSST